MTRPYVYRDEDFRWNLDRPVEAEDFNGMNEVGIFAGPLMTMYTAITAKELKILMDRREEFVLIDVQDREAFEKEHICGAVNIPVEDMERDGPGLVNKDDLVIVYSRDAKCTAAAVAADKLVTLSYEHVLRLQGGIDEWKRADYCTEGRLVKKAA